MYLRTLLCNFVAIVHHHILVSFSCLGSAADYLLCGVSCWLSPVWGSAADYYLHLLDRQVQSVPKLCSDPKFLGVESSSPRHWTVYAVSSSSRHWTVYGVSSSSRYWTVFAAEGFFRTRIIVCWMSCLIPLAELTYSRSWRDSSIRIRGVKHPNLLDVFCRSTYTVFYTGTLTEFKRAV